MNKTLATASNHIGNPPHYTRPIDVRLHRGLQAILTADKTLLTEWLIAFSERETALHEVRNYPKSQRVTQTIKIIAGELEVPGKTLSQIQQAARNKLKEHKNEILEKVYQSPQNP